MPVKPVNLTGFWKPVKPPGMPLSTIPSSIVTADIDSCHVVITPDHITLRTCDPSCHHTIDTMKLLYNYKLLIDYILKFTKTLISSSGQELASHRWSTKVAT